MKRSLTILLLLVTGISACKKNNNGDSDGKACTTEFVTIGMVFTNSDGSPVTISEVQAVNLRTNKPVNRPAFSPAADYAPGTVLLADDATKADFSTQGDEVRVSAKSGKTGKVKSVIVKISGGSNCHVAMISGADKVAFD